MHETMATMRNVLACVILGLSCVLAAKCPAQEDLAPCTCFEFHDIYVTCKSLNNSQDLEKAMQSLKKSSVNELQIRDSNFGDVPNDVLADIDIKHLYLIKSALYPKFPEKPILLGLEDTLVRFTIQKCYPSKDKPMPALAFSHMNALREISIEENYLPVLNKGIFKGGPPGLTHLELIHNQIETIEDEAFVDLSSLVGFSLIMNRKLVNLKRSMFSKKVGSLETLSFERNGIKTLSDDMFSEMPSLKGISLYDNKLTTISETVFSSVYEELDYLNVNGNPIVCDKNIKWLYQGEETVLFKLYGSCAAPENLKDRSLGLLELDDLE